VQTEEPAILMVRARHINLSKGKVAIVDDEDFERVGGYKWHANKQRNVWYAMRHSLWANDKRDLIYMHREIMGLQKGNGLQIDHVNHNGLDNRRCNLRICTNQQNQFNTLKSKNKSSIFKGVRYYAKRGKWCAQIKHNGVFFHLGYFTTEEGAALAYNVAAIARFGEFALLNEIKESRHQA